MVITKDNIESYLAYHRLCYKIVCLEEIPGGRSKVYVVNNRFFLKNFNFNDVYNLQKFKNETFVYRELIKKSSPIIPGVLLIDRYFPILILEYLTNYKKVSKSTDLVKLYQLLKKELWKKRLPLINKIYPWIFDFGIHNRRFEDCDHSVITRIEFLKTLYNFNSITHGDLKCDNILSNDKFFKVIDWEFAAMGDFVWDWAYLIASLILDEKDYIILNDTVEHNNTQWFFELNKHKLAFIKLSHQQMVRENIDSIKFISFLGLALFQRLNESKIGKTPYNNYKYFMSIAKDLIKEPLIIAELISNE